MSTRSHIAIKNLDGNFQSVYCHFDGYLEGVGQTLLEDYKTEGKIRELISNGGMSALNSKIEDIGFYKDRGEDIVINEISSLEFEDLITNKNNELKKGLLFSIEYFYFFDVAQNKWFFTEFEPYKEGENKGCYIIESLASRF